MLPFHYLSPTAIDFGVGSISKLADRLSEVAPSSVLLVSTGDYPEKLGIADHVRQVADRIGAALAVDYGAQPNPKADHVRDLIALAREHHVDFVLAVGGGSAIDTAKAVALGVPYDGDFWDFFTGEATPNKALGVGAISTLPGSGSELSDCAVIQQGKDKIFFESDALLPRFAIVDPSYALSVPQHYQSAAIADMSAHMLEVYATDVTPVDVSDRLIEACFSSLLTYGRKVVADPKNVDARAELHMLSIVTHNDGFLANGRLADWVGHKIEHEISGLYGLVHGEGMAVVTPAWIRYVADRKPAKLVQFASRVLRFDVFDSEPREVVNHLADALEAFYRELGLRTRLGEHGIKRETLHEIASRATHDNTRIIGNYLSLNTDDVVALLEYAL